MKMFEDEAKMFGSCNQLYEDLLHGQYFIYKEIKRNKHLILCDTCLIICTVSKMLIVYNTVSL